jgi:hypothetical protein
MDTSGYTFEVSGWLPYLLTTDCRQCNRCLKAGVVCETDPLHPFCHCAKKKLGCSLMLLNEKTGKTARMKLSEDEILAYCIWQHEMHKGKQPACGPLQRGKAGEASGSEALPSALLLALELDSASSHSLTEAPASDTPHTCTRGTKTPLVPFYIEVPAPPRVMHWSAAPIAVATPAATAPAPAHAPNCALALARACAPAPSPTTANAPTAPLPPPVSFDSIVPTAAHASPAAATTLTTAATPATADSPGAEIGSSPHARSPVLCRFIVPQWREAPVLSPTSQQQQIDPVAGQGRGPDNQLAIRVQALERRMDVLDKWMCRDGEWKHWVEETLRRLDS